MKADRNTSSRGLETPPSQAAQGRGDLEGTGDASRLGELSPREVEVYHWICEGKRDREIATILGISHRTVSVHVRAILAKLEVENRTSAALLLRRSVSSKGSTGRLGAYFLALAVTSHLLGSFGAFAGTFNS